MAIGGQGRMRDEKIPLTAEGMAEKKARLDYLLTVKRPQVADYIHEAKEEQARVEGEIMELEYLLSHAVLLDTNDVHTGDGPRTVRIGSTVEVETDRGTKRTFLVVGTYEADISNGKISDQSPVGKALLGKAEGESVEVTTPGGSIVTYTIRAIR